MVVRWSKTIQTVGKAPVILIPNVQWHPSDHVKAYLDLLAASPTSHPNQPLLTITSVGTTMIVTIPTLVKTFSIFLKALHLDTGLYSLHSLQQGGATAAYWGSTVQIDIKGHLLWLSDAFWLFVTSPFVAASPVAASLAAAMV